MTEMDILQLFYDEIVIQGTTRDQIFLSLEEDAAIALSQKLKAPIDMEGMQRLADVCVANEWLERTTADPNYKYLSLTEAGLQMVLANRWHA